MCWDGVEGGARIGAHFDYLDIRSQDPLKKVKIISLITCHCLEQIVK